MSIEGRPRKVLENIHDDNKAALSAMGKKGAKVREANKQAAAKAILRRDAEIAYRDRSANVAVNDEGDVVPPDDLLH